MHNRDLYILRNILKANTVRLASWDPFQNHSHFLQLCKEYGLSLGLSSKDHFGLRYVIPTFDLGYFLSADARMSGAETQAACSPYQDCPLPHPAEGGLGGIPKVHAAGGIRMIFRP